MTIGHHDRLLTDKELKEAKSRLTARADFIHDDDCPCFGDSVEHSEDCRNCECEKTLDKRVKSVCEKLTGEELLRKLLWRVPILLLDHDAHAEILRRLK